MHVYPAEIIPRVLRKWKSLQQEKKELADTIPDLPDRHNLLELLSICYQVSMMREEGRPVNIRIIVIEPECFPAGKGPPKGFHRVIFSTPRPFNEYELRRLSPAVDYDRSLIGARYDARGNLEIWGLINSGSRWLQNERGGAKQPNRLPNNLVVHVRGPGRLTTCRGMTTLVGVSGGKFIDPTTNVFLAQWVHQLFAHSRKELLDEHAIFREQAEVPVANIKEEFIEHLMAQLIKRIISVTRHANHGGTFLVFPGDKAEGIDNDKHILLKYRFVDDEAMMRQKQLFTKIIQTVTTLLGDANAPERVITWKDFVLLLKNERVTDLEEAIYEHAQFVASMAAVDGAVVLTRNGPIGFGGMIVGSLDQLSEVAMANDMEGEEVYLERIEGSGSRHRSVYHLCNALHDVMAIVVSQDGGVQLAKYRHGIVTCWDLTSITWAEDV